MRGLARAWTAGIVAGWMVLIAIPIGPVVEASEEVTGVVVDSSGEPIESFEVVVREIDEDRLPRSASGTSHRFRAPDGRFRIETTGADRYSLTVRSEGFVRRLVRLDTRSREGRENLEITLMRAATLRVSVRHSLDGSPAVGARVHAAWHAVDHRSIANSQRSGSCDENGVFTFEGLHPGKWTVSASHPQLVSTMSEPFELAEQESRDLEIGLGPGGAIEGVVLDESGAPIANARVSASPRTVRSGADGRFVLRGLSPGEARVTVQTSQTGSRLHKLPKLAVSHFGTVTVVDGETVSVELSRVPEGGVTVAGRIRRGEVPVAGVAVSLRPVLETIGVPGDVWDSLRARTDAEGRYVVSGVPAGRVKLGFVQRPEGGRVRWREITVPAVERHTHDVILPTWRVHGRVIRKADGTPVPGARVAVCRADAAPSPYGYGDYEDWELTDDEGRFVLHPFERGPYRVVVRFELEYDKAPENLLPTSTGPISPAKGKDDVEVNLALERGGFARVRVRGDLEGWNGQVFLYPLEDEVEAAHPPFFPRQGGKPAGGQTLVPGIPPGRYFATLTPYVPSDTAVLTIRKGETTDVTLNVLEGRRVGFETIGSSGRTVGATVRVALGGDPEREIVLLGSHGVLPVGRHVARISHDGHVEARVPFEVKSDDTPPTVSVRLDAQTR